MTGVPLSSITDIALHNAGELATVDRALFARNCLMLRMIATASLLAGLFGALGAAEAKGGNLFQSPCMSHFNDLGCSAARGTGSQMQPLTVRQRLVMP